MELYPAELKKIQTLVGAWATHAEQELEASFGAGGQVDVSTFLAIAQRLRAKGYESLPQDDRLSVLTPEKVRLSLQGLGVIQQYCKDDKLEGKPFTAMIKDRTSLESNVDLEEYDVRVKSRREIPLDETDPRVREILKGWDLQKKAFRLIKRWTFKGKGVRIDMSIVRSTAVDSRKEYRWVRSFLEQNIFRAAPQYEVEVELLRTADTDTPEKALKCLVRGIGEILRAIQKNTLLLRKSVRDKVIAGYAELNKSNQFRGVSPVTLEVKNMVRELEDKVPNIRSGYNVTDKADGLRALGYCDAKGELYLIDMALNVYRTGLVAKECANSLVDGEWVTKSKEDNAINHFLIFDIYNAGGEDVSQKPFAILDKKDEDSRYNRLQEWITEWNAGQEVILKEITELTKLRVSLKSFMFANPSHVEIFEACSRVLDTPRIYHTDGLILTPNINALPAKSGETFYEQFKWKPAKDNTIDFLVSYEKDPETIIADKVTIGTHPDTDQTVRYKTLRLYVGAQKEAAYDDPRATILNELPLPVAGRGKVAYQPILFNPIDFPDTMANICYRETKPDPESGEYFATTEDSAEPIPDRCIVECRYVPENSAGWRWVPMRIRHDKTERFMRGSVSRTLNSEKVANSVWNSINNPVTVSMIRTGSEEPSEEEMTREVTSEEAVGKKYYERKAQKEDLALVRGLRDFHNKWIKDIILYKSIMKGGNKKVLDLAVGKAGDLQRWRRERALFVLGVDTAGENIRNPSNGAYRRYLDTLVQSGGKGVPQMVFVIGDSSKPLITGDAGATAEEADILRAVFGQAQVQGTLPKAIEMGSAGILRSGADVAVCMFALHYFFENKSTLDGLLSNLKSCIKVGGYFAGCCFDGKLVFNMLRDKKKGQSQIGKEGDVPIWSITKEYDADELVAEDESVGLAIDVEFISIGTKHREYLVSFDYLVKRLKEIGLELLTAEECKALGLRDSTNTFETSYKMASDAKKKFVMTDTVKEFSFLNRWFIFKRVGEVAKPEMKEMAAAAAAVASAAEAAELTESAAGPGEAVESAAAAAIGEAASAAAPAVKITYTAGEVVLIYTDAALQDRLKIGDPAYARWLAPTAAFPISDPTEPDIEYPSVNHFIAAMRYKHASNKPQLGPKIAVNVFSTQGSIHQSILAKIRGKKLSDAAMHDLLKEEAKAVHDATQPAAQRGFEIKLNEASWSEHKVEMWEEAYRQRWETDPRFKKIVEAALQQGKYLLYYVPSEASDLGGKRTTDGKIVGNNLVGRIIMELAE